MKTNRIGAVLIWRWQIRTHRKFQNIREQYETEHMGSPHWGLPRLGIRVEPSNSILVQTLNCKGNEHQSI